MRIVKVEEKQVSKIVDISIRAFETDVNVGGVKGDCPPGFDSAFIGTAKRFTGCKRQGKTVNASSEVLACFMIAPSRKESNVHNMKTQET